MGVTANRVLVVRLPASTVSCNELTDISEYIGRALVDGVLVLGESVKLELVELPPLGAVEVIMESESDTRPPKPKRAKRAAPDAPPAEVPVIPSPPRPSVVKFVEGLNAPADPTAGQRLPMSEGEIVASYKQAANPANQIDTLAELNNCSRELILEVLRSAGVLQDEHIVRKRRKGSQPHFDRDVARQLYDEGLSDEEIAANLKVSAHTIRRWRSANGLYRKKESEE